MTESAWDWEEQLEESASDLTRNDRLGTTLIVLLVAGLVLAGLVIRQRTTTATWLYSSREEGLEVAYPAGWLIDEQGDYVMRARDPKARPFNTRYQITAVPAGGQASIRNVLDGLTLQRSTDLSAYRVLSVQESSLDGQTVTEMNFAYVDADPNPFIQRLPTVVVGRDIVIRDGDRAIVATYMADRDTFDAGLSGFERFVASLSY